METTTDRSLLILAALRDAGDRRDKPANKDHTESWASIARRTTTKLLQDMRFENAVIQEALANKLAKK